MERGDSVTRHRRIVALAALLLLLPVDGQARDTVVLVAAESCPVDSIDSLDVRKVYLGIAVTINGNHIRPLRLIGDERLDQVFFQSIVAMSRKSYERRALSLALKFGTPRPAEYDDLETALTMIQLIECSIVYAWADDLVDRPGIKILRPLWSGK